MLGRSIERCVENETKKTMDILVCLSDCFSFGHDFARNLVSRVSAK